MISQIFRIGFFVFIVLIFLFCLFYIGDDTFKQKVDSYVGVTKDEVLINVPFINETSNNSANVIEYRCEEINTCGNFQDTQKFYDCYQETTDRCISVFESYGENLYCYSQLQSDFSTLKGLQNSILDDFSNEDFTSAQNNVEAFEIVNQNMISYIHSDDCIKSYEEKQQEQIDSQNSITSGLVTPADAALCTMARIAHWVTFNVFPYPRSCIEKEILVKLQNEGVIQ